MVVIRLSRGGAKKRPFYKIVVADQRMKIKGRFIEKLGYFNPIAQGPALRLQMARERVDFWIKQGAQASDRVRSLMKEWDKSQQVAAG